MAARELWHLTLMVLSLALVGHQICRAQDLPTIEQDSEYDRQ